jgi:hypothetical protein
MLLTFDDQFLLTVGEDGCLFTWKVFDKDGRGIKREREVGFAEEVLVTKTDMEEKVRSGENEEERRIPWQTALRAQDRRSSEGLAIPILGTDYHSSLHNSIHNNKLSCLLPPDGLHPHTACLSAP